MSQTLTCTQISAPRPDRHRRRPVWEEQPTVLGQSLKVAC